MKENLDIYILRRASRPKRLIKSEIKDIFNYCVLPVKKFSTKGDFFASKVDIISLENVTLSRATASVP